MEEPLFAHVITNSRYATGVIYIQMQMNLRHHAAGTPFITNIAQTLAVYLTGTFARVNNSPIQQLLHV